MENPLDQLFRKDDEGSTTPKMKVTDKAERDMRNVYVPKLPRIIKMSDAEIVAGKTRYRQYRFDRG